MLTSEKMSALFGVPLRIDAAGRLFQYRGMISARRRAHYSSMRGSSLLPAFEFDEHVVEQARCSEFDGEQRVGRAGYARDGLNVWASTISA